MAQNILFNVLSVHATRKFAWYIKSLDTGLLDCAIALVELLQEHVKCEIDASTGGLVPCQQQAATGPDQRHICFPWTLLQSVMDAHSMMLRDAGQDAASETKFKQTLELCTRLGGESHICIVDTLNNLGMVLSEQSSYKESEDVLLRASSILNTIPIGTRDRDIKTQVARNALFLGDLYTSMWQMDKASQYLAEAIAASQEERSVQIHAKWKSALLCLWNGRPHEAEALLLQLVQSDLKLWGVHHRNTREAKLYLAYAYAAQGKEQEAENMMDQVFEHASHARIMRVLDSMTNRSWWLAERGMDASCMEVVLKRGWDEAFRIAQSCERTLLPEEDACTFYARQDRPEFDDLYDQMLLLDPWYLYTGNTDKSDGTSSVDEDGRVVKEEKEVFAGSDGSDGTGVALLEGTNPGDEAKQSSADEVPRGSAE